MESTEFFNWCSSILKTQGDFEDTSNEGRILFDDDSIEMLFFDSLLCLDFSSMTMAAYNCFEQFFCYINIQYG